MKKTFTTVIATMLAASVFFASCGDVSTANSGKDVESSSAKIEAYKSFGQEVAKSLEEALEKVENGDETVVSESGLTSTVLSNGETTADYLLKNNVVSEESAKYISRIENGLSEDADVSDLVSFVSIVESEAIENLSDDDLESVLSYAEVTKATLNQLGDNGDSSRRIGKRFKKFIKVVVATAAGATVGAAVGIVSGAGVGSIPGAVVGGVIGGVTSGAATAASGDISIAS